MKIGIGLPNAVLGTPGDLLPQVALRAEERGFARVATIDRVAYPSHDSLISLAGAAAVTSRIELMTNILLAPLYPPALLAKATASLDQLSGGRLALGLGAGGRADDFAAAGQDFTGRGRAFDASLTLMHEAWSGKPVAGAERPICPRPVRDGRIPIIMGGTAPAAMRRMTTWARGWTSGGMDPASAAPVADTVRAAWKDAGCAGTPELIALVYFSLGDEETTRASHAALSDYYAFLGDYAVRVAESAYRSEDAVRDVVRAFADLGFTGINLFMTVPRLDQVDRLADAVL